MTLNFRLEDDALRETASRMAAAIRAGLATDGAEVACLPAWLPMPPRDVSGEVAVLDVGGTRMRAARVGIDGPRAVVTVVDAARMPVAGDAESLFETQARLLAPHLRAGEPVGYCFSYPAEIGRDRDARLLRWTKGIDVPGVEGRRVGRLLATALERHEVSPGRVTVVNDTVATLMATSALPFAGDADARVGLVVGTGTNLAAFFPGGQIAKLPGAPTMAVNLESGNFTPPGPTAIDDATDRKTARPGRQRFEKAVAGRYLGELFRHALPDAGFDAESGAAGLSDLIADPTASADARRVAREIIDRSADLVAAALAGLFEVLGCRTPLILGEGGLIAGARGYGERVVTTLRRIAPAVRPTLTSMPHATLVGAAVAALAP